MTRQRRVIALTGLSGSGKTTLLRQARKRVRFVHFSASELLKERSEKLGSRLDSETLRLGNFDVNQRELILAFAEKSSDVTEDIVFDCHTVIDTPDGLQIVPGAVFVAIGITDIVFLSVDPQALAERRDKDLNRSRPLRTPEILASHQSKAIEVAKGIANTIGINFINIGSSPEEGLLAVLLRSV